MANKRVDRLEVGAEFPKAPNNEVVWIDVENNNINRYDKSTEEWISVGGSPAGTFDDPILKDNVRFTNSNDDVRLRIEHGGTGVVRIHAPEDDLALRSARDILLYAGDDGPGNVYIGWGDATYTPDSLNRVATIGDIQSGSTGDITFENTKIIGDGTMTLLPDADLESEGRFLVIEPTTPNHIHIRAGEHIYGGSANPELYLGNDETNLGIITWSNNVRISTKNPKRVSVENINTESNSTLISSASVAWSVYDTLVLENGAAYTITSYDGNSVVVDGVTFTSGSSYYFYDGLEQHRWNFSNYGTLSGPEDNLKIDGKVSFVNEPWNNSIELGSIRTFSEMSSEVFKIESSDVLRLSAKNTEGGYAQLSGYDVGITASNGATINGSNYVRLLGGEGEYVGDVTPENQIATIGDLPSGATGSFTTASHTVTVTNGIITDITAL